MIKDKNEETVKQDDHIEKQIHQEDSTTTANSKSQPKSSRLGGGYGGLQHEQYPSENGYPDSGKLGKIEKK